MKRKNILTKCLALLCTFPGDQELLLMQQHSALEKSEQNRRGGTRREGRGKEEKGGKKRKGEGRTCTLHGYLLSCNIAFGKEERSYCLNQAGNWFAVMFQGKGTRS